MDRCSDSPDADSNIRGFASAPASWYYVGSVEEITRTPQRFELPDSQTFVAFRTGDGGIAVIGARCSHMGADLSRGCVKGGRLVCPLHGWEYAGDGKCARIPASPEIPSFAHQPAFPVEVRGGHVFFFNRAEAKFPMPFFDGVSPDELLPAHPFDLWDDVPWYLLGGNGFDRQHFEMTHDRRLIAEPVVDSPHPFARRCQLALEIGGTSYVDRLTRAVAGTRSRMTVTSWCGTMIFASAKFPRVTTYGLVTVRPLQNLATHARVIVWVRRSGNPVARWLVDPLNAIFRRHFIKAFFKSDHGRLTGTRYRPDRMIPADKMLVEYLAWLQSIHR